MSVSIRLSRFGKRHAPSYRVVVTPTRSKRDGSYIEIIGNYNPLDENVGFNIDKELYDEWVSKGAIVSDAVKKLVEGTYEYEKYEPEHTGSEEKTESADETASVDETEEESSEEENE